MEPGTSFDYLIKIPDDHPTGTFWYRPHHHGTAADQQFAGLAGALLVVPGGTDANQAFPQQQLMSGGRMRFGIDNRPYDPDRDDQQVALGTTEIWTITNYGPLVHPFHLHAWPFVVLAGSDATPPTGVAQDVVLVPARGWTIHRGTGTRGAPCST